MDGMHDLGGRQGFGPIDVDEPEEPFHHPWEGRAWAIVRACRAPGATIDWWRHVRELIDPLDYLSRPYFDSWAQTHAAVLIDAGLLTLEELRDGRSATAGEPREPEIRRATETRPILYDRAIDAAPRFAAGDAVRARPHGATGHTRLPAYVRGRPGRIHAHHGAHILPDASARGDERAEHIYSVVFEAADLWPEAAQARRRDRVFLDLWESYLESP
jgi:nitrile hydratase